MLFPCVRPGPDHAHMAPKLINYLKENNYDKKKDQFLGRRTGEFYSNFFRADFSMELKPKVVRRLGNHGFNF